MATETSIYLGLVHLAVFSSMSSAHERRSKTEMLREDQALDQRRSWHQPGLDYRALPHIRAASGFRGIRAHRKRRSRTRPSAGPLFRLKPGTKTPTPCLTHAAQPATSDGPSGARHPMSSAAYGSNPAVAFFSIASASSNGEGDRPVSWSTPSVRPIARRACAPPD